VELLDVRDAENQLNQAKLGLVNEKFNYLSGLLDLEYTLNTKLVD
jgi:outer membrane protein TolC